MACDRGGARHSSDHGGGSLPYGKRLAQHGFWRRQRQHFRGAIRSVRYRPIAYTGKDVIPPCVPERGCSSAPGRSANFRQVLTPTLVLAVRSVYLVSRSSPAVGLSAKGKPNVIQHRCSGAGRVDAGRNRGRCRCRRCTFVALGLRTTAAMDRWVP